MASGTQTKYIKKVQLSDGRIFNLCDTDAARVADLSNYLPLTGGTISGNLTIDHELQANRLYVLSIQYVPVEVPITNVLVEDEDTNEIKKRSTNKLLEDIGGISYSIDENQGVLSLKYGRQ